MSSHRLLPLLLFLLCLALAPAAFAEEVFVLKQGSVVRGVAVSETEGRVVVRLSGFLDENTITLRRSEITRRFLLTDPSGARQPEASDVEVPAHALPLRGGAGVPLTIRLRPDGTARERAQANAGGMPPPLDAESFLERFERRARLGLPDAFEGRLVVGLLLLIVFATLVAWGVRLLGMKAASVQTSTTLGLVLGLFLLSDTIFQTELLRADRAIWIIPLQAVIWLGIARGSLEAPLSRSIPLLAFVLFGSTCFLFATGTLLVSV